MVGIRPGDTHGVGPLPPWIEVDRLHEMLRRRASAVLARRPVGFPAFAGNAMIARNRHFRRERPEPGRLSRRLTVHDRCIMLPFETADGPANMAMDQALLDVVTERNESAYIRTYGWSVPTLSLGYFQRLDAARAEDRWRTVPIVRRATGGGAIWHEHELTYAVALPAGHPLARQRSRLYRAVHTAIAEMMRERGLDLERRGDRAAAGAEDAPRAWRPVLCFSDHDPEDLILGEFKVVGSAQRRREGAILQHGSILLRAGARTPEHRGVCNFLPFQADPMAWSEIVSARIAQALGLAAGWHDPPPELRRRSREIEQSVYRQDSWNWRR